MVAGEEVRALSAAAGSTRERVSTPDSGRTRWLEEHAEVERGRARRVPERLLAPLRGPRWIARQRAADLGHRLGQHLFEQVCAGRLDRRGLRRLFCRPLVPARAPALVLQLLRS